MILDPVEIPKSYIDKGQTLSVAMIVCNEEKDLPECLESLKPVANEIICVIDTRSTDSTEVIAREAGCVVYDHDWEGKRDFAKARNFSLSKCTKDWIFVIDADERVTDPFGLKTLINLDYDTYMMTQLTDFWGMITNCVTTRLWRNGLGIHYNPAYEIHESPCSTVKPEHRFVKARYGFFHKYTKDETEYRQKLERITDGLENVYHPNGNFYQGASFLSLGQVEKGVDFLLKATKDDIDKSAKAFSWNLLAETFFGFMASDFDNAINAVDNSLQEVPNQNTAHIIKANILEFLKRYDEAIKELEMANLDLIYSDCHEDKLINFTERIKKLKEKRKYGLPTNKRHG